MYRKTICDALARFSSRPSIYFNGNVSESPTKRRHSFSHQRYYTWPSNSQPTPYEVMGIQEYAKYPKSRYFDLVKVYHPDSKASLLAEKMPKEERLARYRLIVDAHKILSDDEKRSAYDAYGLGWTLPTRRRGIHRRSYPDTRYSTRNDYGFNHEAEEEFFKHLSGNKKFICFIMVIFIFAQTCVFISSLAKAELQMRRTDEQCRELMICHKDRALDLKTLTAQIERLLLKRDPSGTGLLPTEEQFYREMLPLCTY
ncbi:hypothetical protein N7520_005606 [Penicillium odoratum]|uniref:uncharacterized protein n=1 Tax=Penicillium odoratum TaxID=1167516 RepID=UPI0025472C65|nr:uncharacterized protein N7520_005606 [Penicillium odoratum]KAJ5758450.1 hypothetical protein N7520_005606 [Penicillium odoratum]